MVFVRKGSGERVSADDPEVKAHPERFVAHGRDYREQESAKERQRRAEKKERDKRKS
jgi:hypothetical protein